MRGSHTHGWGAKKKHRGTGSQAGRGMSNRFFARKSSFTGQAGKFAVKKLIQKLYDKKGFVPVSREAVRTISLQQLDELAKNNGLKEIDVSVMGYDKVLGGGKITVALAVKAAKFSAGAKEKIEASGGKAIELTK